MNAYWFNVVRQITGCVRGTPIHLTSVTVQYAFFFVLPFMTIAFLIALWRRNNGIADIAWGLGFIGIAWIAAWDGFFGSRSIVLAVLVTLWGLRLATHIFLRNRGKAEDFRYARMRKQWGKRALFRSYTHVFLLQGLLMLVIGFPLIYVSIKARTLPLTILDGVGAGIWLIGFLWETIADFQLTRFKSNSKHKGKVMDQGLWRYSRHPNYFGEAVQWWGIFVIAMSAPFGIVTIVSPLLITFLLTRVSGIPMLERKYKTSAPYRAYIERTNAFIPWFPSKKK